MIDRDRIVIESTKAHRARLTAAFLHGATENRRRVNNNSRRFMGSVILAAVVSIGCLGYSFVTNLLATQKENQAITAFRAAIAANPIKPGPDYAEDSKTGFLTEVKTGRIIDPQTGFTIDPATGLAQHPDGHQIDPRLDWYFDPETGYYTDPQSGITINPVTLQVVKEKK